MNVYIYIYHRLWRYCYTLIAKDNLVVIIWTRVILMNMSQGIVISFTAKVYKTTASNASAWHAELNHSIGLFSLDCFFLLSCSGNCCIFCPHVYHYHTACTSGFKKNICTSVCIQPMLFITSQKHYVINQFLDSPHYFCNFLKAMFRGNDFSPVLFSVTTRVCGQALD